jgi:hypothetical protein
VTDGIALGRAASTAGFATSIALGGGATVTATTRALALALNAASVVAGAPAAADYALQITINGTNYLVHLTQA